MGKVDYVIGWCERDCFYFNETLITQKIGEYAQININVHIDGNESKCSGALRRLKS